MPPLPGAEPFFADGGSVGVLLCHGFTASPQSLRPWGQYLADQGLTVRLPLLPGHGTTWQDMAITRWPDWYAAVERNFDQLRERCDTVFVMGLSMGGTLALRLAEVRGPQVAGLVLVNASLLSEHRLRRLLPLLRHVLPSRRPIGSDIKKPATTELAYSRVSLHALESLTQLWAVTRRDLAQVRQPMLVFRSVEDHVVEPASGALLLRSTSAADVEERLLHNSYHVATLDHDAAAIFEGSLDFVRRLAPTIPVEG